MNRFKIFAPMLKASMGPDNKMRLHGIASSTVKDRHGDTMSSSALEDMERSANNNLTIFLNHSYTVPEDVAGHVERAIIRSHPVDPDIHDLALDIVINESNQRARDAWAAINDGTQLGLSIGAMIPEGGAKRDRSTGAYQIDHVELLETSLVGVPANPRSWVEYAVKSLNVSWADPDAPAGPGERSDGEAGVVVEYTQEDLDEVKDALGDLTQEDFDSKSDPPEEAEETEETEPEEGESPAEITPSISTTSNSIGDVTFTVSPDIANATVNIKTPYADVSIDTGNRGPKATSDGSSQEALASAPETEDEDEESKNPWSGILPTKSEELIDADIQAALLVLEPTVVASLRSSSELLKAITRELIDTKAALATRNDEYAALEEATTKVVTETAQILDALSKTPVGRRSVVREASDKFAGLESVYSEAFLNLLKRS